ncbi:MAG: DUF6503 family protein, partial [Bacteroidota bacterium]
MKHTLNIVILLIPFFGIGQDITAEELLAKSIAYHDPNGQWSKFDGAFTITSETPKGPNRTAEVRINNAEEYFYIKSTKGEKVTEYTVEKDDCTIAF